MIIKAGETKEAQKGYYMFVACNRNIEAEVLVRFKRASWSIVERGFWGIINVQSRDRKSPSTISISNGVAIFLGEESPDLRERILESSDVDFSYDGIVIYKNEIATVRIHEHNHKMLYYEGDINYAIDEQITFSVNEHWFWVGAIQSLTVKNTPDLKVSVFGKTMELCYFKWGISKTYFISKTALTSKREVIISSIDAGKQYGISHVTDRTNIGVFKRAEELLQSVFEFCEKENIVLSKDKSEIVDYALETPDFAIKECELILGLISQGETCDENRTFKFWIDKTYGKKYYVAAALADNAVGIKEKDSDCWEIEFDGTQTDEIELMEYMFSEEELKYPYAWEYVQSYLMKASVLSRLQFSGVRFINDEQKEYGHDYHITHCLFYDMSKAIKRIKRDRVDELYSKMAKENRLTPRWKNEYHLYSLINSMCKNVKYQYHAEWLGQQSFDIFLEQLSIAIEYQGELHYTSQDYFGGISGFQKRIERDERKKKVANENGVRLLEWHYSVPVNEENVVKFLKANGIPYNIPENVPNTIETDNVSIMAPIIVKAKEKRPAKERKNSEKRYVIRKFDFEGNFIQEYETAELAAKDVRLSGTSIGKCIRGERKSAGGFLWRKELKENLPQKIVIEEKSVEQKEKKKSLPISIVQSTKDGEIVAIYESIRKACISTKIDSKGIRDVLNGRQKTAGGFCWKRQI